mmetsp:Transcript_99731/g.242505  ORF Transcript_99731/g.242505 Transcript_99731/m.242505 type:complete len:208 (-) Transcript_99731:1380-2003(-)
MYTGDCLLVVLWVPIKVEEHNCIGSLEVQPEAPSARGKEENGQARLRGEALDPLSPELVGDLAVQPDAGVAPPLEVGLEDVQDARELREDEDLVAEAQELGQQPVQGLELARGADEPLVPLEAVLEEVGVQGNLPQLHQRVVHLLAGDAAIVVHQADGPPLEVPIGSGLPGAQRHAHGRLHPRRQPVSEHLALQPLKQERREQRVHL